jgi:hypothetical protein
MEQDKGASGKPDRATHEQSPSVSAVPVGIPSARRFKLPVDYTALEWWERKAVREQYIAEGNYILDSRNGLG